MRKMLALVNFETGETREIIVTRTIRIETHSAEHPRAFFDIAITRELEVFARVAGAPDAEPWRESAMLAYGAEVRVVSTSRTPLEGAAVPPSPQVEIDELERQRRVQAARATVDRIGRDKIRERGQAAASEATPAEIRSGRSSRICACCNKRRRWRIDEDGMIRATDKKSCPSTMAQGDACRPARDAQESWEQRALALVEEDEGAGASLHGEGEGGG